jgi:hypothetical protein
MALFHTILKASDGNASVVRAKSLAALVSWLRENVTWDGYSGLVRFDGRGNRIGATVELFHIQPAVGLGPVALTLLAPLDTPTYWLKIQP